MTILDFVLPFIVAFAVYLVAYLIFWIATTGRRRDLKDAAEMELLERNGSERKFLSFWRRSMTEEEMHEIELKYTDAGREAERLKLTGRWVALLAVIGAIIAWQVYLTAR